MQHRVTLQNQTLQVRVSKLSRGFDRDINDVQAMYEQRLFSLRELRDCFEAIAPELIRFPSLDISIVSTTKER